MEVTELFLQLLSAWKVLAITQTESSHTCNSNKGTNSKIAVFFQNKNCCISIKWNKKPRGFGSNLITALRTEQQIHTILRQAETVTTPSLPSATCLCFFVFPSLHTISVTLTDCRGTCSHIDPICTNCLCFAI